MRPTLIVPIALLLVAAAATLAVRRQTTELSSHTPVEPASSLASVEPQSVA
jgi:hypothetical protein